MRTTAWVGACRSWYKNAAGRVTNNWPTWTVRYWFDTLRLRPDELRVAVGDRRPSTSSGGAADPASRAANGTPQPAGTPGPLSTSEPVRPA